MPIPKMPRFVILFHETQPTSDRPSHWDFMLEQGSLLRTWALDDEPILGQSIGAKQLADHRVAYLDYEGPISGGRGTVTRWDAGTYRLDSETSDRIQFQLDGQRLQCNVTIQRECTNIERWTIRFSST